MKKTVKAWALIDKHGKFRGAVNKHHDAVLIARFAGALGYSIKIGLITYDDGKAKGGLK
jgi:hypothetical protein